MVGDGCVAPDDCGASDLRKINRSEGGSGACADSRPSPRPHSPGMPSSVGSVVWARRCELARMPRRAPGVCRWGQRGSSQTKGAGLHLSAWGGPGDGLRSWHSPAPC